MHSSEPKTRKPSTEDRAISPSRRATLRRLGRFAAITPPVVTLLLSAKSRPAVAVSTAPESSRQFKEPVSVPQLRKLA
jgi:hypothetical protein